MKDCRVARNASRVSTAALKPAEAATLYEQIKKEYPSSAVSERADRGLDMLATPKS